MSAGSGPDRAAGRRCSAASSGCSSRRRIAERVQAEVGEVVGSIPAMSLVFALSPAYAYDIAAVAVSVHDLPCFVTALISFAIAGTLRERVENEEGAGEAAP